MASWIVHLRLAEALFTQLQALSLDKTAFYLGNIAIDSGKVNEDLTVEPPVTISHWTPSGHKNECRYEDFFDTYCLDKKDNFAFSFYLGCVTHLLTDNYWVDDILADAKIKYQKELAENKRYILNIKKDWYDQDFLYLKKHPQYEPLEILNTIHDFENIYLPWFEKDAIQVKLDELVDFYADVPNDLEREYPYLDEVGMNLFVENAKVKILKELDRLLEINEFDKGVSTYKW